MPNINKSPGHVAHLSHTGHDMSQTLKFTSSVGQLLPVYYDFLNPNETVSIDAELISKTIRPLKSPALTQIDEYLDWFFVPMRVLYSLFEQQYYQISDVHSSLFDQNRVNVSFPVIDVGDFLTSHPTVRTCFYGYTNSYPAADDLDVYGVPVIQNTQRLCQLLGYGSRAWSTPQLTTAAIGGTYAWSPFLAAAYQAIFYSYYRLTDWTPNDTSAYNLDAFYSSGTISASVVTKLFEMHYRPFRKDLFTNLFPSPLVDGQNIGMLDFGKYTSSLVNDPKNQGNTGVSDYAVIDRMTVNSTLGSQGTAKIRGMFALEKLLDITRRSGKHVDDQVLAHFGVKVPERRSCEVIHIGSTSSVMNVSQLQATAAGENGNSSSTLGEYAGNLDSYCKQRTFKFSSEENHGILMCIYSAVPRADYSADTMFDKINSYSEISDLYFPEFDNLGMYPQFAYQLDYNPRKLNNVNNRILGWQYRYQELKQKADRVAGGLLFDLRYWTTLRNQFDSVGDDNTGVVGTPDAFRFYCPPTMLNSITPVSFPMVYRPQNIDGAAPSAWTSVEVASDFSDIPNAFVYDPLVHMIAFDVKKSSTMSVYSLSSL